MTDGDSWNRVASGHGPIKVRGQGQTTAELEATIGHSCRCFAENSPWLSYRQTKSRAQCSSAALSTVAALAPSGARPQTVLAVGGAATLGTSRGPFFRLARSADLEFRDPSPQPIVFAGDSTPSRRTSRTRPCGSRRIARYFRTRSSPAARARERRFERSIETGSRVVRAHYAELPDVAIRPASSG